MGLGSFPLCYLRDKEKREVDFAVVRDGKPWFMADVNQYERSVSPALKLYQDQLNARFAFQVVIKVDFIEANCSARARGPKVVPARTLLS